MTRSAIGRIVLAAAIIAVCLAGFPGAGLAQSATTAAEQGAPGGERRPVFVAGPWRVAVVAAVRQGAIPAVGLLSEAGNEWVLIVADVTNQAPDAASLAVPDLALLPEGGGDPGTFAPNATPRSAAQLGTDPDVSNAVAFAAGETRRLTTVYQIPATFGAPVLTLTQTGLPLATALQAPADLTALPQVVPPPPVEQAAVAQVLDGSRIKLSLPGGHTRTVRLSGVAAPTGSACFAKEATQRLTALAGDTVWLEPGDGSDGNGYVWAAGDSGRVLVNRQLIADGAASLAPSDHGRFADWMAAAQRSAQRQQLGLWGACVAARGTTAQAPSDAAPAAPPATADACAGAMGWALATAPRLQRATTVLQEFKNYDYADPTLPATLRQHAAEFADLADAKRAMNVPAALARSNEDLAAGFAAWSDAYDLAAQGLDDDSAAEINLAVEKANAANDLISRASDEFKSAARDCGFDV